MENEIKLFDELINIAINDFDKKNLQIVQKEVEDKEIIKSSIDSEKMGILKKLKKDKESLEYELKRPDLEKYIVEEFEKDLIKVNREIQMKEKEYQNKLKNEINKIEESAKDRTNKIKEQKKELQQDKNDYQKFKTEKRIIEERMLKIQRAQESLIKDKKQIEEELQKAIHEKYIKEELNADYEKIKNEINQNKVEFEKTNSDLENINNMIQELEEKHNLKDFIKNKDIDKKEKEQDEEEKDEVEIDEEEKDEDYVDMVVHKNLDSIAKQKNDDKIYTQNKDDLSYRTSPDINKVNNKNEKEPQTNYQEILKEEKFEKEEFILKELSFEEKFDISDNGKVNISLIDDKGMIEMVETDFQRAKHTMNSSDFNKFFNKCLKDNKEFADYKFAKRPDKLKKFLNPLFIDAINNAYVLNDEQKYKYIEDYIVRSIYTNIFRCI